MAACKTSPSTLRARETRAKAVALRRAGVSFADIASQLGISKSAAHKTVSKALAELHAELTEQAHLLQAQEADRLDYAQARLAPQIAAGHLGAIDRLLRIMERRARLLGLDEGQPLRQPRMQMVHQFVETDAGKVTVATGNRHPDAALAHLPDKLPVVSFEAGHGNSITILQEG